MYLYILLGEDPGTYRAQPHGSDFLHVADNPRDCEAEDEENCKGGHVGNWREKTREYVGRDTPALTG